MTNNEYGSRYVPRLYQAAYDAVSAVTGNRWTWVRHRSAKPMVDLVREITGDQASGNVVLLQEFVRKHGTAKARRALGLEGDNPAPTKKKPKQKRIKQQKAEKVPFDQRASKEFLQTYEWRKVRMMALKASNGRCECCGASPKEGAILNVDHIKPRRFFPELALEVTNLQVLCHECNHGKGNWDMTDWREARA